MRILIFIVLLSYLKTSAQSLAPVSLDKFSDAAIVFTDTAHNKLIVSSKGSRKVGSLDIRGIASWNGIKWDSLTGGINTHNKNISPYPQGIAGCGVEYGGKYLVGGLFFSMGNINSTGLALWDGVKWDSLPKRAFRFEQPVVVTSFLKKGGLLYFSGSFDSVVGKPTNSIATWDGVNFNPIILPVSIISPSDFYISSIVEFQNEIYICGGLFNIGTTGAARDVYKFNGTSWVSTTGTGLFGSFDSIGDLIIYNNDLYACGHILQANGNAGNHIIKWNGTSWQDVGFGNTPSFIGIEQMLVYRNQLWVFGSFTKVANVPASNIAVYDGVNWCSLQDTVQNKILSATVYRDTIYVAGGFTKINSDTNMAYIAKIKYPTLYSHCVKVGKDLNTIKPFVIYPNPTNSILYIEPNEFNTQDALIKITNTLGQIIYSQNYSPQIDISFLASGMYYLTISDGINTKTVKVIKE